MAIKTVIGKVARGENFFNRTNEIRNLWNKIESEEHILIVAPRRVGKTSLMHYIKDNPKENYKVIYLITESINNENDFFKRIFDNITDSLEKIKKYSNIIAKFIKDTASRVQEIKTDGISLGESKLNYYDELIKLIKSLDLQEDKIILMIDEFAQTVENIILNDGDNQAIQFLQKNRELRQMSEINKKITFIYAGSIGLENIVGKINATSSINDLSSFHVKPLKKSDATDLINKIIDGSGLILADEKIEYILNKIKWFIPFYIQLVIGEIDNIANDENNFNIDEEIIDSAFKQILDHRNHFEHWDKRLRKAYKQNEYNFAKKLLNFVSNNDEITSNDIVNLAIEFGIENEYKDIVNSLIYDGYINNNDDPQIYRFNSPILRMWWHKNVAN